MWLARSGTGESRARVEVALVAAFDALYARGDAAAAGILLEELGPGIREASGSVNAALAYVYWWQARGAGEPGGEGLMTKAKEAWRKAKDLRLDPSALGGSLFAPAFVAEMSGL